MLNSLFASGGKEKYVRVFESELRQRVRDLGANAVLTDHGIVKFPAELGETLELAILEPYISGLEQKVVEQLAQLFLTTALTLNASRRASKLWVVEVSDPFTMKGNLVWPQ
jgi:hypothetical protein